jgi:hypothetical protein
MRLFSNPFLSEGYFPHIRSREPSSVNMIQLSHSQEIVKLTSIPFIHGPCEPLTMHLEGRNEVENRNGACVMEVASLGSRAKITAKEGGK